MQALQLLGLGVVAFILGSVFAGDLGFRVCLGSRA